MINSDGSSDFRHVILAVTSKDTQTDTGISKKIVISLVKLKNVLYTFPLA